MTDDVILSQCGQTFFYWHQNIFIEKIKVITGKNTTFYWVNEFINQQTELITESLILILSNSLIYWANVIVTEH